MSCWKGYVGVDELRRMRAGVDFIPATRLMSDERECGWSRNA